MKNLFLLTRKTAGILLALFIALTGSTVAAAAAAGTAQNQQSAEIVEWKQNAWVYPAAGQLVAAGPIYIKWNHKLKDATEYLVYFDGTCQGSIQDLTKNILEYNVYTTDVSKHTVRVEAVLSNGGKISSNERTFFVSKKGIGSGKVNMIQDMSMSWYYNWSTTPVNGAPSKLQFVPMIWGDSSNHSFLKSETAKEYKTILGYNEPDFKDQSNMSVNTVINNWPKFMESDLRIGSPATGVAAPWSTGWFKPFMEKIETSPDLDVDFIAVHCYLDWADDTNMVQVFLNMIDDTYRLWNKPIWITEFGIARWDQAIFNQDHPERVQDVYKFMNKVLPELDKRPYVERYAWFPFDPNSLHGGASGLYDIQTGKLNQLGMLYRFHGNPEGYTMPNPDGSIVNGSIPQDKVIEDDPIPEQPIVEEPIVKEPIVKEPIVKKPDDKTPPVVQPSPIVAKPQKEKITSIRKKKTSVILKWKRQTKSSGYEIYMSKKKSTGYKKIKTIEKAKTYSYTKKKLKKNSKYYFKVRAYKKVSGNKLYGKFSAPKGIKI